jgi:sulfotransferase
MKIFFNSSMPRSGSTLLQNILGNNPSIYATPTSPILEYILSSKKRYTESPVVKAQDETDMKSAYYLFCRFGLEGYFNALTEKPYVIDKSRGWAINAEFLNKFYPNPKIICMVRDLREILGSMEGNFRKHPDKWDAAHNDENARMNVYQRVSYWMNSKPVGDTLKKLYDSIHRGHHKYILFLKFEDLCERPKYMMQQVYEFLEIPYYAIDYENVKQVTYEDDKFHGIYGDHKIKNKIEPLQPKAEILLGDDLCDKIYKNNNWYFDFFNYSR